MSSNLLRLSVIQKICENWSTTAVKVKGRFDPQTQSAGQNFCVSPRVSAVDNFT